MLASAQLTFWCVPFDVGVAVAEAAASGGDVERTHAIERLPLLLTPTQAADVLGLLHAIKHPQRCVLKLVRTGQLSGRLVGGGMRITRASLEQYLSGQAGTRPRRRRARSQARAG